MPLPAATSRSFVCLVTSGPDRRSLSEIIVEAAEAGVDLVQIREPSLDDRTLLALTRDVVAATRGTRCRVVVNDRVDIALAGGAAGVHLRGNSYPASRLRTVAPAAFLIGRSIHSVEEAGDTASAAGCDYLMFGTVFSSASKPASHTPAGLEALRAACAATDVPVIAIGGITVANARSAIDAGAHGIAAIGLFRGLEPIAPVIARLRREIDT